MNPTYLPLLARLLLPLPLPLPLTLTQVTRQLRHAHAQHADELQRQGQSYHYQVCGPHMERFQPALTTIRPSSPHVQQGQTTPIGSARARLLWLSGSRLALGSSALPTGEAGPPGAPPLPRALERAATEAADVAACGPPVTTSPGTDSTRSSAAGTGS